MSEQTCSGMQILKRTKTIRREPTPEPLDPLHAAIGLLGVFYESQLIYLKHQLENTAVSDRDHPLIVGLKASHALIVNLCSAAFGQEPVDDAVLSEFRDAIWQTVQNLSAEGKGLVQHIEIEGDTK